MTIAINKEIIDAINHLIDEWGSALEIERRLGITNSTISKYRSGKIPRMSSATWNLLEPHLNRWLKKNSQSGSVARVKAPQISLMTFREISDVLVADMEFDDSERGKILRILAKYLVADKDK